MVNRQTSTDLCTTNHHASYRDHEKQKNKQIIFYCCSGYLIGQNIRHFCPTKLCAIRYVDLSCVTLKQLE